MRISAPSRLVGRSGNVGRADSFRHSTVMKSRKISESGGALGGGSSSSLNSSDVLHYI